MSTFVSNSLPTHVMYWPFWKVKICKKFNQNAPQKRKKINEKGNRSHTSYATTCHLVVFVRARHLLLLHFTTISI